MSDATAALVRELVACRASRRSGRLEVRATDLTTTLVLADGEIVGVQASRPGEPLGRILTRKHLLTQEHYIDVLERMSSALAVGEKVRFGELAVELGYVTEQAVRECLTEQQRVLASRAFQSSFPTWTFDEAPVARDASREAIMHVESLFLDAVRWADDARKGALGLDQGRPARIEPAWSLEDIDARFELTPDEGEFARMALMGERTVAELLESSSAPESVDVHALLTALLVVGAGAPVAQGRTPSAPPPSRSGARKGPPPLPAWALDGARAKSALAKIVLTKISVAPPSASKASNAVELQLRSEQASLRGQELLRNGNAAAALIELERALELKPDSAENQLFVSWLRLVEDPTKADAAVGEELEAVAQAALRDNAKFAFGYFILGEAQRERGHLEDARRQLRHALRLEPDLLAGIRAHRLGGERASSPALEAPGAATAATAASAEPEPAEDAAPEPAASVEPEPAEDAASEPAATAASAEPEPVEDAASEPAATPAPAAPPAARSPAVLLLGIGALILAAGAAIILAGRAGSGDAVPVTTSEPSPAASVATSGASGPEGSASATPAVAIVPVVRPRVDAEAASSADGPNDAASSGGPEGGPTRDSGPTAAAASSRGLVVLGPSAAGHRVFVDGRVVPSEGARLDVACGRHEIRVGSHGKNVVVVVPCAGQIALP